MKKIPTIYSRDPANPSRVTDVINTVCQWVFDGEGTATRKFDGTAVLLRDGRMYKRYDCKKGRTPPDGFIPADDPDSVTGHWPGWVVVTPDDKWHLEALTNCVTVPEDGTHELLFPRFQGRDSAHINPEHVVVSTLVRHGSVVLDLCPPITHEALKTYFDTVDCEGIVWHHPDGRMAKIKSRDFGKVRV